jgi:ubiquinone/menaquinone biosynthesis C-methylase UbiE
MWSVAAEWIAPKLFAHAVGDWRDVAAYAAGGLIAGVWWSLGEGFDLLARYYPWMERVLAGPKLQRCRTTWVGELPQCQRVLIAGVGHGPFLHEFLPRHPQAEVTCLDASAEMLRVAESNARKAGLDLRNVKFVHASLPAWEAPIAKFDLIVTNFFLDCFEGGTLARVIAALDAAASPDARWLLADFSVPERGLARWRARAIHMVMYAFFRVVTGLGARQLTDPDPLLHAHGFSLTRRATSEWGLLRADLWHRGLQTTNG